MDAQAIAHAARRLVAARKAGIPVSWREVLPADRAQAFAIQDATLAALGPAGGWKVGATGPAAEPGCAPLLATGLLPSGSTLLGPPWRMRGIEVEVAVRLGRDLADVDSPPSREQLLAAIDAVLPVMEVVETRLADWRDSNPLAQLADLQTHGALVLGPERAMPAEGIDLRDVMAYLAFDGQPVASARGANAAEDMWRLLGWLAVHCARRGNPLRAGQIVTTGSCSGLLFAPEGAHVQADLQGIGRVELRF
jgi:2-keto-4-pentenoate hydratase